MDSHLKERMLKLSEEEQVEALLTVLIQTIQDLDPEIGGPVDSIRAGASAMLLASRAGKLEELVVGMVLLITKLGATSKWFLKDVEDVINLGKGGKSEYVN